MGNTFNYSGRIMNPNELDLRLNFSPSSLIVECIWFIVTHYINKGSLAKDDMCQIFIKMYVFLKLEIKHIRY